VKRAPFFLLFVAACGGNVVVDGPAGTGGHAGAGGTTTTTTIVGHVASSSSFVASTSVSSGTGTNACGSLHVSSSQTCELCVQMKCCQELSTCDRGTPGGELIQCVINCKNDPGCTNACLQKFPAGANDVKALSDCIGTCPCSTMSTSVCDSGLVAITASCDACLTVECCPEAEACAGSPACQMCLAVNAPASCAPAYAPLAQCRSQRCPAACT
jgi:hypothetical protein